MASLKKLQGAAEECFAWDLCGVETHNAACNKAKVGFWAIDLASLNVVSATW